MSRIGKKPVLIPKNVKLHVHERTIQVEGPKGVLKIHMQNGIETTLGENQITFQRVSNEPQVRALHGLQRALVQNMVSGVTDGFKKSLEIIGVGYRASMKGKDLNFAIGFSHPVVYEAPAGIVFNVEGNNITASLPTRDAYFAEFKKIFLHGTGN